MMNMLAPVSSIMHRNFFTIEPEMGIGKAEKWMEKKGVRFLVVEKHGEFKGLITQYDCRYFKESLVKDGLYGPDENLRMKYHTVKEIMKTKMVKLGPTDTIRSACEIMRSIIFQMIPVIDDRRILGILTPEIIRRCEERQNTLMTSTP